MQSYSGQSGNRGDNMVKENTKNGFSLAEALISMLVVSMFFLATSKIMTHREPDDIISHSHGFCACYFESGSLKMDCVANNSPVRTTTPTNKCTINLPRDAIMYNLAVIENDNVYEKSEIINESLSVIPGSSIVIDGNTNSYNSFKKQDDENVSTYKFNDDTDGTAGYRTLLSALQDKATFLYKLGEQPRAIYVSW